MARLSMMIAVVLGLSACHAGFGIGANSQQSTRVASSALESSVAQASIGEVVPASY